MISTRRVLSAPMQQSDFNHYSPVFTNRPWANEHGMIVQLRREPGRPGVTRGRTGPREWGGEHHLYPQDLEDKLGRFESKVAVLYDKLLRAEPLTPPERLLWSRWILCQFARTPTLLLELAGFERMYCRGCLSSRATFPGPRPRPKSMRRLSTSRIFLRATG